MPGSFIAVHYPGSIRKGDDRISQEEYLKYLLEQYQNLIYSICLKSVGNPFDAEDLTQEVFLSAYKNLSRFDGTYEKAWLSKIADAPKVRIFWRQPGGAVFPQKILIFLRYRDTSSTPEALYLKTDSDRCRYIPCASSSKSPYKEVVVSHFCKQLTVYRNRPADSENPKPSRQLYRARAMLKKLLVPCGKCQRKESLLCMLGKKSLNKITDSNTVSTEEMTVSGAS